MKLLAPILLSFLLPACSENKPVLTENEKNHLSTQDSLIKYKSDVLELSGNDTSMISDFIQLDYEDYKTKYQLSEKEMDVLRRTLNVRCEQAKAFKAIQQNMSRSIPYSGDSKDTLKGNYSFDQKLKPKNVKENASDEEKMKILMDAYNKK